MNVSHLSSKEVIELLEHSQEKQITNATYRYKSKCVETVTNLTINNVAVGKRVLIIDNDGRYHDDVLDALQQMNVQELVLDIIALDNTIHAQLFDLNTLLRKNNPKPIDLAYYQLKKQQTNLALKTLIKSYAKLNTNYFDDSNWQSLVDFKAIMDKADWSSPLSGQIDKTTFNWNVDEFFNLRKEVSYKSYNYKYHFLKLTAIDPFEEGFYGNLEMEEKLDEWITTIQNKISELHQLQKKLQRLLEQEQSLAKADNNFHFVQLQGAIFKLQSDILLRNYLRNKVKKVPANSYFSFEENPFDKELRQVDDRIKNQVKFLQELPLEIQVIDVEQENILEFLNTLNSDLLENRIDLTKLNSVDPTEIPLAELGSEVQKIQDQINALGILKSEISFSQKNVSECIQDIIATIIELGNGSNIITYNEDYVKWMYELSSASPTLKQSLDALSKFDPEEWIELFEKWYILNIVDDNYNHSFPDSGTVERYNNLLFEEMEIFQNFLLNYWNHQKLWANKTFSIAQQDLKRVQRSSTKWLNAGVALSSWSKYISYFYPICIISRDTAKKHKEILRNWDCVISIDSNKNEQITKKDLFESTTRLFNIDSNSIASAKNIQYTSLKGRGYSFGFAEDGNRIEKLKFLVDKLCRFALPKRIYQKDEQLIFSFWSEAKSMYAAKMLEDSGFKKIAISEDINELMHDLIVPDKKQILFLLEDGLLNLSSPESNKSQLKIIDCLKNENFECINIWSKEFYISGKELIEATLSQFLTQSKKENQSENAVDLSKEETITS